jgi:Na+-driven multidrug efflux pump
MAEGLQPVFSYFSGTGERERNRALLSFAIKIFLGVGVLCYLLILLFARDFITVFAPGDIQLIDFTHSKSLLYFCGFFLAGFNILMISYCNLQRTQKRH